MILLAGIPLIQLGVSVCKEKDFTETHAIALGAIVAGFYKAVEGRVEAKDDLLTPRLLPGRNSPDKVNDSLLNTEEAALAQSYIDQARLSAITPDDPMSESAIELAAQEESQSNGEVFSIQALLTQQEHSSYKITFIQDSAIKKTVEDSSLAGSDSFRSVNAGDSLDVLAYERTFANHIQVKIVGEEDQGWQYLYVPHIRLFNREGEVVSLADQVKPLEQAFLSLDDPIPPAQEIKPVEKRRSIKLPTGELVFLEDPILPGGHFSWAEATKGWSRPLTTEAMVSHVRAVAKTLEGVRKAFGGLPVTVTSWYRDPAANKACGGSSKSRHLTGGAVDFYIKGISEKRVFDYLERSGYSGGLAIKPGVFTHVDDWMGSYRRWKY